MMKLSRRALLVGSAISTATLLSGQVDARFPRGGAAASGFNNGKAQLQDGFIFQNGTYCFINMMKMLQGWTYVSGGGSVTPTDLDTNGYPNTTNAFSNGGVSNIVFLPSTAIKSGLWVLTWDGRGTTFVQGASVSSGSFSNLAGAASGRCEFNIPDNSDGSSTTVGITAMTSGSDYVHNMKLFYKADETDLNAGQVFTSDYLTLVRAGNPGVTRFLDWQQANESNVTTWATRKPVDHYSYYANEYRASLYGGQTTGSGDAFVVTYNGGVLTDKLTVHVRFNRSASSMATCTFSIDGGSTFKTLVDHYFSNDNTYAPASGVVGTAVYDADLQKWMLWGGFTSNQQGLINGVPPEIMLRLCTDLRSHPWLVTPPLASDPVTDWATSLDAYMQANAPSWMIPRYETPNEMFNTFGGFYCYNYSLQKASVYWGTANNGNLNWQGLMTSLLGQAIAAGRASPKVGYKFLTGVQSSTYQSGGSPTVAASNPKLNCVRGKTFSSATPSAGTNNVTLGSSSIINVSDPFTFIGISSADHPFGGFTLDTKYFVKTKVGNVITFSATLGGAAVNVGSVVDATVFNVVPATTSEAYNWVNGICVTNYVNPTSQNTLAELTYAYQYVTGTTSAATTYQASNTIVDGTLLASYKAWYNWANGFATLELHAYEGGWSPDYKAAYVNDYGVISAATKDASGCVLDVSQTNLDGVGNVSGNVFVVGMPVTILDVLGMTQLNTSVANVTVTVASPGVFDWGSAHGFPLNQALTFASGSFTNAPGLPAPLKEMTTVYVKDNAPGGNPNKFTISATPGGSATAITTAPVGLLSCGPCFVVTEINVSGNPNKIRLNVDSSAFSTYTSGGRLFFGTYGGPNGGAGTGNMTNRLKYASKYEPQLQADTLLGYQQFTNVGNLWGQAGAGQFPSMFILAGTGNVWSVWDKSIYEVPSTPPQWSAFVSFNH